MLTLPLLLALAQMPEPPMSEPAPVVTVIEASKPEALTPPAAGQAAVVTTQAVATQTATIETATDVTPKAPIPVAKHTVAKATSRELAPEVITYSGKRRPRVDIKKPYMRVWFWPPTPQQEEPIGLASPSVSTGSPTVDNSHIQVDPIHFATASSNVLNDKGNQHQLVAWLQANHARGIVLDGHADVRGSSKSNEALARRRAEAVKASLVQQGVSPDQIKVESHGKSHPLKANTNNESWWMSRRVEVHLLNADATVQ